MGLSLIRLMLGIYQTNCYILCDEKTKKALIIDPGYDSERIIANLNKHKLEPTMILLTHGHTDHYGAVAGLKKAYNIPLYLSELDQKMLDEHQKELDRTLGLENSEPIKADKYLHDGDVIDFEGHKIKVIATPGHTQGSVCFLLDQIMFSGDMLFQGSIGRTDLLGGSYEDIMKSLSKILKMDGEITVYPGHGPATTIGFEKENNYFARLL